MAEFSDRRIHAAESMHKIKQDVSKENGGKDIKITVVRKEVDI